MSTNDNIFIEEIRRLLSEKLNQLEAEDLLKVNELVVRLIKKQKRA